MIRTRRVSVVGRTVAALALIGVLAASCSTNVDGDAAPPPSTPAAEAPVGGPASPEDAAEIIAITKTYITGINNGDAKMIEHSMCSASLAMYGDLTVGARPSPTPQQINDITEISVAGDVAFGMVGYTLVNDPDQPPGPMPLAYKNEDGWKVCTEP